MVHIEEMTQGSCHAVYQCKKSAGLLKPWKMECSNEDIHIFFK